MSTRGAAPEWAEGDVDVGGLGIHYHRTGSGDQPPVVLAHGFSDNGLCWTRVARQLESRFDVVMVDARNHGASGTAPGDVSAQAADLAAVITALGLDRPQVVGHSLGAAAAAELAADHPTLVSRLVLEDPPWLAGTADQSASRQDRLSGHLRALAAMSDAEIVALGEREHPDWHDEDRPAWVASKREVRLVAGASVGMRHWGDVVPQIECPTLLVHGDPDRGGIVTVDVVRDVEASNSLVSSRFVEAAGHNIRRENFARFVEIVLPFLEGR